MTTPADDAKCDKAVVRGTRMSMLVRGALLGEVPLVTCLRDAREGTIYQLPQGRSPPLII